MVFTAIMQLKPYGEYEVSVSAENREEAEKIARSMTRQKIKKITIH